MKVCYEAGPARYVLYGQLTQLSVACEVVAPSLVPVKAGDRVKTDRRDAEKLGRCYRAGEFDASMGAGCSARSLTGSGTRSGSGQEGPVEGPGAGWANFYCGTAVDPRG